MIYFTSDLHLGHSNIIRMCNRPFNSVEEMNNTLIGNWNSRVTNRDDIYILGDLFYKAALNVNDVLEVLKGKALVLRVIELGQNRKDLKYTNDYI